MIQQGVISFLVGILALTSCRTRQDNADVKSTVSANPQVIYNYTDTKLQAHLQNEFGKKISKSLVHYVNKEKTLDIACNKTNATCDLSIPLKWESLKIDSSLLYDDDERTILYWEDYTAGSLYKLLHGEDNDTHSKSGELSTSSLLETVDGRNVSLMTIGCWWWLAGDTPARSYACKVKMRNNLDALNNRTPGTFTVSDTKHTVRFGGLDASRLYSRFRLKGDRTNKVGYASSDGAVLIGCEANQQSRVCTITIDTQYINFVAKDHKDMKAPPPTTVTGTTDGSQIKALLSGNDGQVFSELFGVASLSSMIKAEPSVVSATDYESKRYFADRKVILDCGKTSAQGGTWKCWIQFNP